jgi:hypothetical protein
MQGSRTDDKLPTVQTSARLATRESLALLSIRACLF